MSGGWIGYTDQNEEGRWQNVHGEDATYLPWGNREPASGSKGEREDCVIQIRATWHDIPCTMGQPFLCQFDAGNMVVLYGL